MLPCTFNLISPCTFYSLPCIQLRIKRCVLLSVGQLRVLGLHKVGVVVSVVEVVPIVEVVPVQQRRLQLRHRAEVPAAGGRGAGRQQPHQTPEQDDRPVLEGE